MKTIRCIYMYWFYKLYMFGEKNSTYGYNDWKAVLIIGTFEMLTAFTLVVYYELFSKKVILPNNPLILIGIVSVILGVRHYNLYYKWNRWKRYVRLFDQIDAKKQSKYTKIYYVLTTILICNIILMYISLYSV